MHLFKLILPMMSVGVALATTCSNGIYGLEANGVCCVLECGECGGSGCGSRNGLTKNECCTSTITDSGIYCGDHGAAPCIIQEDSADKTDSTADPTCSNGVSKGDVCCVKECETCGGAGCGSRNGLTGDECCTGAITTANESCDKNSAPCIMQESMDDEDDSKDETTDSTADPTCSNGVSNGDVCCVKECETCGGAGCGSRNGLTGDECCTGAITTANKSCDKNSAPCIMEESADDSGDDTVNETPDSTADPTCSNGVSKGDVCCVKECETCGGTGCGSRNGLTGDECCTGAITTANESCDTNSAPCIMQEAMDDSGDDTVNETPDSTADPTCSNGVSKGDVCCVKECETCGDTGCGSRNGLTGDECCTGDITTANNSCDTNSAPCVMSGAGAGAGDDDGDATNTSMGGEVSTATSCGGVAQGIYCCKAECGEVCGGTGCSSNGDRCCTSDITDMCSDTGMAPCLMESGATDDSGTTFASTCTDTDTVEIDIKKDGGYCYIRGGGCATLTDIYTAQGGENSDGPLFVLDSNDNFVGGNPTGYWLLARTIKVEQDSLLQIHGSDAKGDADVLRIQSTGSSDYYSLWGHGGSLHFESTKVTSWDTDSGKVQEDWGNERSFIRCISEELEDDPETCDGAAKNDMGECRMDIISSEISHLGWFDAESYGLSWKVRGYCKDESNPEIFDKVQVRGDILDSDIHNLYYGHYTYGHQDGQWLRNKMHDNIQYGFDPHDDSDNLEIAYNTVYNNGNHGIIASKRCNNVLIHDNEVYNGGEGAVGIFLHRSSDKAEVYDNDVHDMEDAGMAIMESMDAHIHDNSFKNVKYGVRLSVGAKGNVVENNVFDGCSDYGLYTYQGSDEPDASESWDGFMVDNEFKNNEFDGGLKVQQATGITITGNTFTGSDHEYRFEDSSEIVWSGNTVPSDTCFKGDQDADDFEDYDADKMPEFC